MKWTTSLCLAFVVFALLAAGWLCYIGYLEKARNRACLASTVENERETTSPLTMKLQDVINDYSKQSGNIGLQVTVVFPDGVTWNGVSGYADIGNQCLVTRSHHFYLGSMTKLFTASLVMQQVEKGSLTLDETIDQWIQLPHANNITIRNLLNHTSGLQDYAWDTLFQIRWFGLPDKTWQPAELASAIRGKPLRFAPGSRHEYSNSNYLLLGTILEKVTRKPYSIILNQLIRGKVGLKDTYFLTYPADLAIANGYDESLLHLGRRNLTGFRRSLESGAYAAGGILSSSHDMARFAHALFNGQVVSNASLAEMETFIDASDEDIPEQTGYGLGLRHLVIDGESLVGHTGSIPGYSGIAMHQVEKNYTIAILSNLSTIEQTKLLVEIQRITLNALTCP